MKNTFLIIMAGGIGTRFWPISRSANPKQFHDVLGVGKTMLQQTAERFEGIIPKENIYVVTSAEFADLVKEQLPYLHADQILKEPQRRNTAPCIAYAAYKIGKKHPKAKLIVAPADHVILKEEAHVYTLVGGAGTVAGLYALHLGHRIGAESGIDLLSAFV
jgi:mannose-1-phosphate guanylyltransferase